MLYCFQIAKCSYKIAMYHSQIVIYCFRKDVLKDMRKNQPDDKYISTKEASEILGVSVRRVVGLCNEKFFPGATKKGRDWKILEESVLDYYTKNSKSVNTGTLSCAVGNTSYIDVVQNS